MNSDSQKIGLFIRFKLNGKSRELFDYSEEEIKNINEINSFIDESTFIIQKKENNNILRIENQSYLDGKKGELLLYKIRKNKNNTFFIENPLPTNISVDNSDILNIKLWYILNSGSFKTVDNIINKDYYLNENDIIKFGRIKYVVKEIYISSKNNNIKKIDEEKKTKENNNLDDYDINNLNKNNSPIFNFIQTPKELLNDCPKENSYYRCYFCNENQCTEVNPLIKFCLCNFIHYNCLKANIKKKMNIIKKENVYNYFIKGLKCLFCNAYYPLKFKKDEKVYNLFEINKPIENDYLILESIENKIYFGQMKLIHIIKLKENHITIGRKEINNNVIICDPSVSKYHAIIKYNKEKGEILLTNISKKYGTFVLIKNALKINKEIIQIQIGNILIEANTMKYEDFEKIKNQFSKYPLPKK